MTLFVPGTNPEPCQDFWVTANTLWRLQQCSKGKAEFMELLWCMSSSNSTDFSFKKKHQASITSLNHRLHSQFTGGKGDFWDFPCDFSLTLALPKPLCRGTEILACQSKVDPEVPPKCNTGFFCSSFSHTGRKMPDPHSLS